MPIVAARKTLIDARQCPICLETYKAPFQVNCGHTFCHECVLAHVLGHGWDRKREFLRARADDDDDDDDDDGCMLEENEAPPPKASAQVDDDDSDDGCMLEEN